MIIGYTFLISDMIIYIFTMRLEFNFFGILEIRYELLYNIIYAW